MPLISVMSPFTTPDATASTKLSMWKLDNSPDDTIALAILSLSRPVSFSEERIPITLSK